jgi:AcrR family transcriptional regulator
VLGNATPDWRSARRANATADIVAAAWELARENGLSGLSLRDLARHLGMAAPSLYSYFDSKHALYDAMYADGYRALLARGPLPTSTDLRAVLHGGADLFVRFALEDPVRFQLLSQRTIPGFEPSPASYRIAQDAYDMTVAPLRAAADVTQEDLDLLTAMVTGLINQQLSNEPGGTRWVGLLDDVIDLVLPRFQGRTASKTTSKTTGKNANRATARTAPARGRRPSKETT